MTSVINAIDIKDINYIFDNVQQTSGVKLTKEDFIGILKSVNKLDIQLVRKYGTFKLVQLITKKIVQQILNDLGDKSEEKLDIDYIFGLGKESIYNIFAPSLQYKHIYLSLDIINRDPSVNSIDYARWNYSNLWNYQTSGTDKTGYITATNPVENIIAMKMLPFNFFATDLLFGDSGRIANLTVYIKEFDAQALTVGRNKYHFGFRDQVHMQNYLYNRGYYTSTYSYEAYPMTRNYLWFQTPVQELRSLTLYFSLRFTPTYIPVPYTTATFLNNAGFPLRFQLPALVKPDWLVGRTLRVYNYTTDTPEADAAFIVLVNRREGHVLTSTAGNILIFSGVTVPSGVGNSVVGSCILTDENRNLILPIEMLCLKSGQVSG